MTVSSLSTLPPAPLRSMPAAEFKTVAQTHLVGLNTLQTEMNISIGEFNADVVTFNAGLVDAADYLTQTLAAKNVAVTAANYFGQWAALTGSFAAGGSVSHLGGTWMSTTAIADITASEPSLSNTDWDVISLYVGLLGASTVDETTLTASSESVHVLSPTGWYEPIHLPDATTLIESTHNYLLKNTTKYSVPVLDDDGDLLGFVRPHKEARLSLGDNSTAAGVWTIDDLDPVGVRVELMNSSAYAPFSMNSGGYFAGVDMGGGRTLLFYQNASNHLLCQVWNEATNVVSAIVTIRTGGTINYQGIRVADGQVLVCSDASGNFEAVLITLSGDTPVVNTAGTATLSASLATFALGTFPIVATGTGEFVVFYAVSGQWQLRAITISGTTVTVGSATNASGTVDSGRAGIVSDGAGKVITYSNVTTTVHVEPFSISGTTITPGTKATQAAWDSGAQGFMVPWGSYWLIVEGSSAPGAMIVTLSGTTVSLSFVSLGLAGIVDSCTELSSTKWLFMEITSSTLKATILTNTSGTASAGTLTATVGVNSATPYIFDVIGTDALAIFRGSNESDMCEIDCSGATPVIKTSIKQDHALAPTVNNPNQFGYVRLPFSFLANGSHMVYLPYGTSSSSGIPSEYRTGWINPVFSTSPRGYQSWIIVATDSISRVPNRSVIFSDNVETVTFSGYIVEISK